MKILLLGEYSNVHNTLAQALRHLGHEVLLVSDGDGWKDYPRDIDVKRGTGLFAGLRLWIKIICLLRKFRGYDIVQLINPVFFDLKAERHYTLYKYLKKHNGKVVMGAFGMDYYWAKVNTTEMPLRYSDFNIGKELRTDNAALNVSRDYLNTPKGDLCKYIADDCDGIIAGLYEYWVTYSALHDKTEYIPYPIDCSKSNFYNKLIKESHHPKIFIGISRARSEYKGTDIMLKAMQDLQKKYHDRFELTVAEGVPYEQYCAMLDGSDILLDQLYSYTPAMNALLAMSKGIVVVGGGEEENYEILDEKELRPIINVLPTYQSIYDEMERIILHPELLYKLKHDSIKYICKHHDMMKVAKEYITFYNKRLKDV